MDPRDDALVGVMAGGVALGTAGVSLFEANSIWISLLVAAAAAMVTVMVSAARSYSVGKREAADHLLLDQE
jgi:hypothetical protein